VTAMTWAQAFKEVREHVLGIPGHATCYPLVDLLAAIDILEREIADRQKRGIPLLSFEMMAGTIMRRSKDRTGEERGKVYGRVGMEVEFGDPARFVKKLCEWADDQAQPTPTSKRDRYALGRIAADRLAEYNEAQDAQPTPTCLPTGGREWDPDEQGGELFACKPGRVIE